MRKAGVYAQASSLQLRRVEWITEDAGFAPPGPMRAQGASVPMAVSVPIATGEETLQPPAKRHCELGYSWLRYCRLIRASRMVRLNAA